MGLVDKLMDSYGGDLNTLVAKFESSGLGDKVKSWIGTGDNQPVTGAEVKQALGKDELGRVAAANGVDPDEAADRLADELPGAVDRVTPDGSLPSIDDVKERLSGLLGR